jgi:hypothetical protein
MQLWQRYFSGLQLHLRSKGEGVRTNVTLALVRKVRSKQASKQARKQASKQASIIKFDEFTSLGGASLINCAEAWHWSVRSNSLNHTVIELCHVVQNDVIHLTFCHTLQPGT